MSRKRPAILLVALSAAGILPAQGPTPRVRVWCPRPVLCVDDRLEVVFQIGGSDFEIDEFVPGTKVTATVVMDTKSDDIQGWSYGVRHDGEILRLDSGRRLIEGVGDFIPPLTSPVFECLDADPRCAARGAGAGFITAVLLSLTDPATTLDVGRNALVVAEYELITDPGVEGTFIEFTDRLARKNSPPVAINITVSGRSRAPWTVIDGWVKRRGDPGPHFHRGDPDGDGRSSISDAVFLLLHLAAGGPAPECLEAADFDDGGHVDLTDAVALLDWLFRGGPGPPDPGPPALPCAPDPSASAVHLGCGAYSGC